MLWVIDVRCLMCAIGCELCALCVKLTKGGESEDGREDTECGLVEGREGGRVEREGTHYSMTSHVVARAICYAACSIIPAQPEPC